MNSDQNTRARICPSAKPVVAVPTVEPFSVDKDVLVDTDILIRPCTREDLPTLDRIALSLPDRDAIEAAFQGQATGDSIMLIADANGSAAGQVWVDLTRFKLDRTGLIWALHVVPRLRNRGVGTRLVQMAERLLINGRFRRAELSVERHNVGALRLYRRLGYRKVKTIPGIDGLITADRTPVCIPTTQHLLRKTLSAPATADERHMPPTRRLGAHRQTHDIV